MTSTPLHPHFTQDSIQIPPAIDDTEHGDLFVGFIGEIGQIIIVERILCARPAGSGIHSPQPHRKAEKRRDCRVPLRRRQTDVLLQTDSSACRRCRTAFRPDPGVQHARFFDKTGIVVIQLVDCVVIAGHCIGYKFRIVFDFLYVQPERIGNCIRLCRCTWADAAGPLANMVALLAWSASQCSLFAHLAASLHRPQDALRRLAPRRNRRGRCRFRHEKSTAFAVLFRGGEGETRTPAPVTRPTPLAGAPRHQLEYFSMAAFRFLYQIVLQLISMAERVGFEPTVPGGTTVFKTVPL